MITKRVMEQLRGRGIHVRTGWAGTAGPAIIAHDGLGSHFTTLVPLADEDVTRFCDFVVGEVNKSRAKQGYDPVMELEFTDKPVRMPWEDDEIGRVEHHAAES